MSEACLFLWIMEDSKFCLGKKIKNSTFTVLLTGILLSLTKDNFSLTIQTLMQKS